MRTSRRNIPATLAAIAIVFWVSLEPALHAARVEDREPSLPERIFVAASDGERVLRGRPFEERDPAEYPRVIDLYRQVTETAAGLPLGDRALVRMADLTREMAIRSGDASQFGRAIDSYRLIVTTRPKSPYLGDALVAIAQIYEYELQDVDGATAAYRELQRRFPGSVAGREAAANLARLDPSVAGASGTSVIGAIVAPGAELPYAVDPSVRVLNVRSFAGPNYARIVVDLSDDAALSERRSGTRVSYTLAGAELSDSLVGRRLSTPSGSLLKGMRVEQMGDGVTVTLDLETLGSAAAFLTDEPRRLVIDLRGEAARPLALAPGLHTRESVEDVIGRSMPVPTMPKDLPPLPVAPAAPEIEVSPSDRRSVRCVVIDPGHGGQDTGTIGPGGLYEKDVTLDVARRLRASLRAELPGVEIVLTRDGDRYVSLEERTATANAKDADLFVSIHANASQHSSASGVETFVADEHAIKQERVEQAKRANLAFASVSFASQASESRSLARFVQGSLVSGLSAKHPSAAKDRGIKHASFAVLRGAHMPSILAEVSFVSNPEDENRLRTPAFRQRIASSLTSGIRGYVRSLGG
jgi:N-acetylmuramoyl-L-alanine amidase